MAETVWLHGAGLSGATWGRLAPGRCLDLPGHRAAPRAARPDVAAFADEIEPQLPERFSLVGHSLGGMIAIELASRHPGRVAALVLVETVYSMRATRLHRTGAGVAVWLTEKLGPKGMARLASLAQGRTSRRHVASEMSRMSPEGLADAMAAAHGFDDTDALARLTMPVLILIGSQNPSTHALAYRMARQLPDARVRVLKGGHMLHMDAPEAFNATVQAFLRAHP